MGVRQSLKSIFSSDSQKESVRKALAQRKQMMRANAAENLGLTGQALEGIVCAQAVGGILNELATAYTRMNSGRKNSLGKHESEEWYYQLVFEIICEQATAAIEYCGPEKASAGASFSMCLPNPQGTTTSMRLSQKGEVITMRCLKEEYGVGFINLFVEWLRPLALKTLADNANPLTRKNTSKILLLLEQSIERAIS